MKDRDLLLTRLKRGLEYLSTKKLTVAPLVYQILKDLIVQTTITALDMREIMNGAFVVIHDDVDEKSNFYSQWRGKESFPQALSSHASLQVQFRVSPDFSHPAPLVHMGEPILEGRVIKTSTSYDVLIGTRCDSNATFLQFERNHLKTLVSAASHLTNWVVYEQFKKKINVGPFGTSTYTESNPPFIQRNIAETHSEVPPVPICEKNPDRNSPRDMAASAKLSEASKERDPEEEPP